MFSAAYSQRAISRKLAVEPPRLRNRSLSSSVVPLEGFCGRQEHIGKEDVQAAVNRSPELRHCCIDTPEAQFGGA